MIWKRNNFSNSANNNDGSSDTECPYNYMDVKALSEQAEQAKRDVELAQAFFQKCQNEYHQAFTAYMNHCQQELKRKGIPLERRSTGLVTHQEDVSSSGNTNQ